MSDDGEGNTDENTARIDARGNTGVQTNTVIGEINISVQNPEIEKGLNFFNGVIFFPAIAIALPFLVRALQRER